MVAASCSTSLTLSWETSCDSHKVHRILTKIIKSIQWSWPWQITTITLRCYSYFNIMQYQYHICTQQYSWKRAWNNHSPRAENAQINPCKTCEGIERIPCKNLSQDSSQHFVRFVFLPSAAYSVLGAPEASIRHTLINFFWTCTSKTWSWYDDATKILPALNKPSSRMASGWSERHSFVFFAVTCVAKAERVPVTPPSEFPATVSLPANCQQPKHVHRITSSQKHAFAKSS